MFSADSLELVPHFNVIFIMIPSNNERKLHTNNQNPEGD